MIENDPGGGKNATQNMKEKDKETQKKVKPIRYYKKTDNGPFIVYVESENKDVARQTHVQIAKDLFYLNFTGINKIQIKGLNRISVDFSNYNAANNFINNEKIKGKGYHAYISFTLCECGLEYHPRYVLPVVKGD